MHSVDSIVIGAGVVGLAVARALAAGGREVLILEADTTFGTGTSSRNSEVIHAGIYYPRDSLKARLCVRGRELLYAYCAERGIAHRRCGKLIVATDDAQLPRLAAIADAARGNGVEDLRFVDRAEALALEPELHCVAGLLSPSTGIVDSHGLMLALLGEAEAHGAMAVYRSRVTKLARRGEGVAVWVNDESSPQLTARLVVNCAGLWAPALAASIEDFPAAHVPTAYFAKGNYFTLQGRSPFRRLVYPLPEPGGLGVHLTLDLDGRARFGPDVEWVDQPDYQVDPAGAAKFYQAIRRYWPGLGDDALVPAYAGVRPKISGPGEAAADFRISGPDEHGYEGIINLFGIESPGLTSSLAIAEYVAELAGG